MSGTGDSVTRGKPVAYWATLEHYRTWLAADAGHRKQVEEDGELSVAVAARIAREYSIARTIGEVQLGDDEAVGKGLPLLVKDLNDARADWRRLSLSERARTCEELARKHRDRASGEWVTQPVSAVTKLMWFLEPSGWTMYDSLAQSGLAGASSASDFYGELERLGFQAKAKKLGCLSRASGFEIFGERIIDKFLMLRGSHWKISAKRRKSDGESYLAQAVDRNRFFVAALPDQGAAITALADQIAALLPDSAFATKRSDKMLSRYPF